MKKTRERSAFTVIELLVVVGVCSVLTALLLPAVQSARESSRRVRCQSNLHQIGLALQGYENDNGCYPVGSTSYSVPDPLNRTAHTVVYRGKFGIQVRLLPYLDLRPVYDATNFAVGTDPPDIPGLVLSSPDIPKILASNATSISSHIGTFLCPSDGGAFSETGNNYRGNVGTGPYWARSAEFRDSANGLLQETGLTRASYVTDGLSHTAAFSERLRGSGQVTRPATERDFWPMPRLIFTADELLLGCKVAARAGVSPNFTRGGQSWFWLGRERTLYSHTQQPNGRVPDCLSTALPPPGMSTARSWHPGGVNVLMGDGSTRFAKETIDLSVWRGLGTRSGAELVD